jgi:hypothetical protein
MMSMLRHVGLCRVLLPAVASARGPPAPRVAAAVHRRLRPLHLAVRVVLQRGVVATLQQTPYNSAGVSTGPLKFNRDFNRVLTIQ